MNKIESYIKNRKPIFRVLCLIISLCMIVSLVGSFANLIPDKVSRVVIILYYVSIIPMSCIEIENFIDRILYFIMVVFSLLTCSCIIITIVEFIFHNTYINVYFGITAFFVFGYLYEIMFREEYNCEYTMILSIPVPKTQFMKDLQKAWAQSSALIGYFCNVLRILLLILAVFEKQYNWGLLEYPISEAVVTSLAFEKVIKVHYKKLGTPLD